MASLTCPTCGKDNPDFLDNCQFCQTALRREATLNIGENPTKKSTGELEEILPDWLRDARKQSRDLAEEEAKKESTKPRIPIAEPDDLLAGLAFQAASDEEEVPDWLAAINPVEKKTPASSKPAEEAPSDFFAQFNQPAQESSRAASADISSDLSAELGNADIPQKDELTNWLPPGSDQPGESFRFDAAPAPAAPAEPEDLSWLHDLESSAKQSAPSAPAQADMDWMANIDSSPAQPAGAQEDLSWLNNLGGIPASTNEPQPAQPASSQEDLSWLDKLGGASPSFNEPAPSQPASSQEDLSWLNNLGGTTAASFDKPASAQPSSSQEDLSWLNNLGGTPAPSFNEPASSQPASSQEDLSWLNNLGGTPAASFDKPAPAQPSSSQEDLSWLNNLGGTPSPSVDEPAPSQPAASQEDLSWLSNLGDTPAPAPAQPALSQDDVGWLNNLGGTPAPSLDERALEQPVSASQGDLDWLKNIDNTAEDATIPPGFQYLSPRHTAPLSPGAQDSMPDWLKSATEEPSMPPLGATSMDWFTSKDQAATPPSHEADEIQSDLPAPQISSVYEPAAGFAQTPDTPAFDDQNAFASASDSGALSNQDVDSLFAVDMPDWLSQPEPTADTPSKQAGFAQDVSDSLAPVNLPSWVQAMRPVEAAISEASAVSPDQTTEKEGPLAGFRGVIPFAPIGSAQRPKAISLKLQASNEQQAGAALLEQILAGETTARPLKSTSFVVSQRALRWTLSVLFVLGLGIMLGLGTRQMPVSSVLPVPVSDTLNVVATMPDASPVLVVIDYEPSFSGEMEAVAGPLLYQMAGLRHPNFTFISTSPNGPALAERLMTHAKVNQPGPDGLGYQTGSQYINAGYLPGGSAGVRGFTEQPQTVMPLVRVNQFSEFSTVVIITDHAESGLVWIEQLELLKKTNPAIVNPQLLAVASAQAGPLLQPYVLSKQVAGMLSGLSDGARYEFVNNSQPGIARAYWDAFGVGLFLAVASIVLGSLWSLFTGIRARRAEAGQV